MEQRVNPINTPEVYIGGMEAEVLLGSILSFKESFGRFLQNGTLMILELEKTSWKVFFIDFVIPLCHIISYPLSRDSKYSSATHKAVS